ncbi:hypothetical protein [Legionella drancourtii]|uniref:Uncharacterized protein n=1 Tax=Legionella drancourtii LLAP12 TaxID=658187 RepID=G9ES89_9GAMM|nr:hypothetical protein [Legionella drancourtii]EHL29870.1 hypothetical protein LDG_8162 [Legionella drancourtii LLAP12]
MVGAKELFGMVNDFNGLMMKAIESLPSRHLERIGFHFIAVVLDEYAAFPLKKRYKPQMDQMGEVTLELRRLQGNYARLDAQKKILKNRLEQMHYENDEGSVKLHLSINDIAQYDADLVKDIVRYMAQQQDAFPNMRFKFKLVRSTTAQSDSRFQDNDQFTLYFDKYSSIKEVIDFGKNMEQFLKAKGLPENERPFGPKDIFGLNSFISVRADNNKLTREYGVYTFFDLELQKFYESYKDRLDLLEQVPLAALETVFHSILIDKEIIDLPDAGLSAKDSEIVQKRFNLIVQNPGHYLNNTIQLINDSGVSGKFQGDFSVFDKALLELKVKETNLRERNHTAVANEVSTLHAQLLIQKKHVLAGTLSWKGFQSNCTGLVDKAMNGELAKVRDLSGLLIKIAAAIVHVVTLGTKSLNWETDSVKKLAQVKGALNQAGFFGKPTEGVESTQDKPIPPAASL